MGDKRETYVTAWSSAQERELLQKGWTQVGRVYLHENDENPDYTCRPVLAPPKPPTLAERMRALAERLSEHRAFTCAGGGWDCLSAADALERAERIEAAAQHVVDEILPIPYGGWSITHEDLDALIDALKKAQ